MRVHGCHTQCLSSLAEQKSCQLAYVLFLLPYFLSPAALQGIRMWLLGIEENGLWAAALVCVLELVMDLPELCLIIITGACSCWEGMCVVWHRWSVSGVFLQLGSPSGQVMRLG